MICQHCHQDRPRLDRGEYSTCSNCGHHQFKDPFIAKPGIPPPERRYNTNQLKLGAKTMQTVNNHLTVITEMRKKRNSWYDITKKLVADTGHSMNPKTVQKYYERSCNV